MKMNVRYALASGVTIELPILAMGRRERAARESAAEINRRIASSERRWRGLVQNASTGVILLDERAEVVFVSDAMKHMLSHPVEPFLGHTLEWTTHATDWPIATSRVNEMLETDPGGSISVECRAFDADISTHILQITAPLGNQIGRRDRSIVKGMITLAQDLVAITVAEGIENDSELHALQKLGCDRAQGYLFWHPLEAADAEETLLSVRAHQGKNAA